MRGLPWPNRAVVWLLLLPIMVGLWIWEAPWPALVGDLGAWNVVIFFPWQG